MTHTAAGSEISLTNAQGDSSAQPWAAYALIQLSDGNVKEVLQRLRRLSIVDRVDAVKGPYQLIARLAVDDSTALRSIEGIARWSPLRR